MMWRILRSAMRYPPEHKAQIHQKIVKDASRRVRAEGLTGAAVAAVMRDTGLTHGGFYKHFESKDELLSESVQEAFQDITDKLVRAAGQSRHGKPWKAIVNCYLSLEYCDRVERGCPMTALAPELARLDRTVRNQVFTELVKYRDRMIPFMPGRKSADKERAFFVIFSTMIGAVQIARMLPDRRAQQKVLASARTFLLRSF
jgi:TetR/AcrR family transcriptional regulator, transcriptional repressor for nem operon